MRDTCSISRGDCATLVVVPVKRQYRGVRLSQRLVWDSIFMAQGAAIIGYWGVCHGCCVCRQYHIDWADGLALSKIVQMALVSMDIFGTNDVGANA